MGLPSFQWVAATDPLDEHTLSAVAARVSTWRYAGTLDPAPAELTERGTSSSAVSRRFVALSAKRLRSFLSRPVGELDLRVVCIDGKVFQDHCMVVALGINEPRIATRLCRYRLVKSPRCHGDRQSRRHNQDVGITDVGVGRRRGRLGRRLQGQTVLAGGKDVLDGLEAAGAEGDGAGARGVEPGVAVLPPQRGPCQMVGSPFHVAAGVSFLVAISRAGPNRRPRGSIG